MAPSSRACCPYDTPDIILVRRSNGEPYLVLEETTDSCSSDKAFQRFARMRGAAENGLIGLHAATCERSVVEVSPFRDLPKPQANHRLSEYWKNNTQLQRSYVVYPFNAGLTPTDRSDANQWQTDEGDQDTMWQRIGSVVGILMRVWMRGFPCHKSTRMFALLPHVPCLMRIWKTGSLMCNEAGRRRIGIFGYRSDIANSCLPSALGPEPRLAAGVPAAIIGDSTHVHRYLITTDAYMRSIGRRPLRGPYLWLRTLYVEGARFNTRLSFIMGCDMCSMGQLCRNPEIKGFECFDTASRACWLMSASERFHQHLRVSGTKSVARILPCGLREHPACRRLKNRHQHKRLSGSHRSRRG